MLLNEFPDLAWLKDQIARGFRDRLGWANNSLQHTGFPSVIINAVSTGCFRPRITGPFSIFLNIRGKSRCSVDSITQELDQSSYFISNQGQEYTLQIHEGQSTETETFNIHFGDHFVSSTLNALVTPTDLILDRGTDQSSSSALFFNQAYRRTPAFDNLVGEILQSRDKESFDNLLFQEQLTSLLHFQLQQQRHIIETMRKLPVIRNETRLELYRRLSRAKEYLQDLMTLDIFPQPDLDTLAAEACLSKFHFLRLFRTAFGCTPHQYLQQLRIKKAGELLSSSRIPIADLAFQLGFESSQSFSRMFFQHTGIYPSRYRLIPK